VQGFRSTNLNVSNFLLSFYVVRGRVLDGHAVHGFRGCAVHARVVDVFGAAGVVDVAHDRVVHGHVLGAVDAVRVRVHYAFHPS
jgi:hypothetical protein